LLIGKGIFTKNEFVEMVKVLDREMQLKSKLASGVRKQTSKPPFVLYSHNPFLFNPSGSS